MIKLKIVYSNSDMRRVRFIKILGHLSLWAIFWDIFNDYYVTSSITTWSIWYLTDSFSVVASRPRHHTDECKDNPRFDQIIGSCEECFLFSYPSPLRIYYHIDSTNLVFATNWRWNRNRVFLSISNLFSLSFLLTYDDQDSLIARSLFFENGSEWYLRR